jgi:predicted house-cleaning noncanonical NTP pyrophosphatase (MazG superfamily)
MIRATGKHPQIRRAAKGERLSLLMSKLQEEVIELQRMPCVEECADVLEVLFAIAGELEVTPEKLFASAAMKAADRGGFREGYVLALPEGAT